MPGDPSDSSIEDGGVSASSITEGTGLRENTSSSSSTSLAREETKGIRRTKKVVCGAMLAAALLVSGLTFAFIRKGETEVFEKAVFEYSQEIESLVHQEAKNVFKAMDNFATTMSSFAIETDVSWPLIDVPHFEVRGEQSNELTGALQIAYAPLVSEANRSQWEAFATEHQGWIDEALSEDGETLSVPKISSHIYRFDEGDTGDQVIAGEALTLKGEPKYAPVWQQSPAPIDPSIVNFDLLTRSVFEKTYCGMLETGDAVLSSVAQLDWFYGGAVQDEVDHPHSLLLHPIFPDVRKDGLYDIMSMVGFAIAILPMDTFLSDILHEGANGMIVVLHDTCGEYFTYEINGPDVVYLGEGDHHDSRYDDLAVKTPFAPFLDYEASERDYHCLYDLRIYPSKAVEDDYRTSKPAIFGICLVLVFLATSSVFLVYDYLVARRHRKVVDTAKRASKIVGTFFPSNVRDRLMNEGCENTSKQHLKSFLSNGSKDTIPDTEEESNEEQAFASQPIADLFPHVTVMFADIAGFTAWSSEREPSQVFTLLETLFGAFDNIAKKRKVFKVETVGDCYVAVAGLPDPCTDHALVMSRFARDCLRKMNDLTKKLEVSHGPDTGDLTLRVGLHSGPVTAGVLRGERSRFQLFGDTMNTTARIESTGSPNKVHLSNDTAELIIKSGMPHWVTKRENTVHAKGKGELTTYWLELKHTSGGSVKSGASSQVSEEIAQAQAGLTTLAELPEGDIPSERKVATKPRNKKEERLIGWNVDIILRLLRQLVARRAALDADNPNRRSTGTPEELVSLEQNGLQDGKTVLDEVSEIVKLPSFNENAFSLQKDPDMVELSPQVVEQVRNYVGTIASLYRNNPFHSFEHASHVTMSTVKLLSRIVSPNDKFDSQGNVIKDLHFGITTDPLTRFSCIFSALIHDVDHVGVPNGQLIKENAPIARVYKNRSVAEQNSVDLAWNLLMDDDFTDFRRTIYSTISGYNRFRKLVVNGVMATDIMDKGLKDIRNGKWDTAFKEAPKEEPIADTVNRKATIVVEHLIQASDVSHTMQHWHVFLKWNERLFREMYAAYKDGRAEKDPSEFWYKGEIGFFDFYIIPLANKLKQCGVFGVSSDEYLNYAMKNRREWESRGQEIVESYLAKIESGET